VILRLLRVAVVGAGISTLFALSRQATLARGEEELPGMVWAIGLLTAIFLVSAVINERRRGPEANLQKDGLWGLAVGGLFTVLSRLG
jgi:hypothetical protein